MCEKTRTFIDDQAGNATIEFVCVFPVLMLFVMMVFETGFIATRSVLLERGLDVATRDLRLGTDPSVSHDSLRQSVCANSTILVNCERDLILEVVEYDAASAYPQNQANCIDRTETILPTMAFSPGGRDRIMFVRACMIIDPIFPGLGI
ncbi:MAG TPA: TadE family protein, partial [Thermohalobaculum sp.]|nr:TadE family protein [Thermohalobaculum sp.]